MNSSVQTGFLDDQDCVHLPLWSSLLELRLNQTVDFLNFHAVLQLIFSCAQDKQVQEQAYWGFDWAWSCQDFRGAEFGGKKRGFLPWAWRGDEVAQEDPWRGGIHFQGKSFRHYVCARLSFHPFLVRPGAQYTLDQHNEQKRSVNIVVTQPRKLAASSMARRVCNKRGRVLGGLVVYQVGVLDSDM